MRLVSPVYGKELVQLAHNRRHSVLKLLFLVVLCLCTAVVLFPLDAERGVARARLGLAFFATLFYVTLLAAAVFTPLVTSGCIAGEREANTLPLLLHTRLTPRNIVQDKGLSRITHMLYLASLTFPFLALTLLLGGVEITHVVAACAYVLGTVLFVGGLSLFFSALRETTLRALASTYLYGVVLLAVTSALAALVCGLLNAGFPLALVNPAVGMAMLLERNYDGLWIDLAAGGYLLGAIGGRGGRVGGPARRRHPPGTVAFLPDPTVTPAADPCRRCRRARSFQPAGHRRPAVAGSPPAPVRDRRVPRDRPGARHDRRPWRLPGVPPLRRGLRAHGAAAPAPGHAAGGDLLLP